MKWCVSAQTVTITNIHAVIAIIFIAMSPANSANKYFTIITCDNFFKKKKKSKSSNLFQPQKIYI